VLASNVNVRDVLIAETLIFTRAALGAVTEHLG
jgi:ribosomal protein L4